MPYGINLSLARFSSKIKNLNVIKLVRYRKFPRKICQSGRIGRDAKTIGASYVVLVHAYKEGATEEIVGSNPTSGSKIIQEEVIPHMYYDYEERRNSKMDGKAKHPFAITCRNCGGNDIVVIAY